jgi:DNA-binding MarR family transcriptional regulator
MTELTTSSTTILTQDATVTPAIEELASHLEELLTEVGALAIRVEQDARRVQATSDLPAGGSNVLRMLNRFGSLTVPQMARLDSTSRQNIQTIVNRLERAGCVVLSPNPAHKRSELVKLSDRGIASLEVVSRSADSYRKKLLPHLSKADLARASGLLRTIRKALGDEASPRPPQTKLAARTPEPDSKPRQTHRVQVSFEESELPVNLL